MSKQSMILKIFSGDYKGIELPPPQTKEYINSLNEINKLHECVMDSLLSESQDVFLDYEKAVQINNSELADQYFKEGFSLAVRLIFEATNDN